MIIKQDVAAVIIGRNEGDRLKLCIQSLHHAVSHIVYVDSGSVDGSVDYAKSNDVTVVELDLTAPFTAARARNVGAKMLLASFPETKYIQFVDGDCEVRSGWVDAASVFLEKNAHYAIACGRRRERYPKQSIYNLLCDVEWNTQVGDANACGGDALVRVQAFNEVDGYRADLIAGEEPEMCFRMRQLDWKIVRLDAEMTLHDAGMTKLSQWWKRHKRAGHAYAEGYWLHGQSNERYKAKENKSILIWSLLLPTILLLSLFQPLILFCILIYPVQVLRLSIRDKKKYKSLKQSAIVSLSNLCAKFPQLSGWVEFHRRRMRGEENALIEYK